MVKKSLNKQQVSEIINNFINVKGENWEWDDFISIQIEDNYLDSIRMRCAGLPEEFPPAKGEGNCNNDGLKVLQNYISELSKN